MTLFLLAQAGVPLTSGFMAKFSVFSATVDAQEYSLVIVGVLAAVVAMFFYLRLIVLMYMRTRPRRGEEAERPAAPFELDPATAMALGWPRRPPWCSASCPVPSSTSPGTRPCCSSRAPLSSGGRPLSPGFSRAALVTTVVAHRRGPRRPARPAR